MGEACDVQPNWNKLEICFAGSAALTIGRMIGLGKLPEDVVVFYHGLVFHVLGDAWGMHGAGSKKSTATYDTCQITELGEDT